MKKQITLFVLLLIFSSGVLFAQTSSYTDSVLSKKTKMELTEIYLNEVF